MKLFDAKNWQFWHRNSNWLFFWHFQQLEFLDPKMNFWNTVRGRVCGRPKLFFWRRLFVPKDKNRTLKFVKRKWLTEHNKIALFFTENKYLQGAIHLVGNASHLVITLFLQNFLQVMNGFHPLWIKCLVSNKMLRDRECA